MNRRTTVVISSILGVSLYAGILTSGNSGKVIELVFSRIVFQPGMAQYLQRFFASALLLGLVPVSATIFCRIPLVEIGLSKPVRLGRWWFAAYIAAGALVGLAGYFDTELASFYPYHPDIQTSGTFVIHASLYFVLYYIPWELTFRGFMIVLVTKPLVDENPEKYASLIIMIAMLQAAPSAILHYGHPISETIGAAFFGLIAGFITVKSRSIFPALAIHASTGITLDLLLVVKG